MMFLSGQVVIIVICRAEVGLQRTDLELFLLVELIILDFLLCRIVRSASFVYKGS